MKLDPILSLALTMHAGKGVYALLLGSGVSRPAGIPTGWDVVLDLVRRLAKLQGEDCEPKPEAWFKNKFGEEPDYSQLLNSLASTPEQRQQILRDYFEPNADEREQGLKQPTKAHRAIARLVAEGHVRIILTTNFDRLTERAIEDEGITPVVITTPEGLAGCLPLAHQRCTIIKLHGDYLDTRVKNTPKELRSYGRIVNKILDRIFDEYGLVVAGWSGEWDIALRSAIERCPTRRFGFFWTSRPEPGDVAKRLVNIRGGSVIRIADADGFFEDLATKLEVLNESSTDHPVNIAVAVALVKRYAGRAEHHIRLHDLLIHETDLVFKETDRMHQAWRAGSYNNQHRKFMEDLAGALSKLRKMVGQAAYWSGEELIPVIVKCVARLAQEPLAPRQSGLLRNDWLRAYLGAMVMYSAGVGYISAGKFVVGAKMLEVLYSDGSNRREQFLRQFTYNIHHIKDALNQGQQPTLYFPFSDLMFGLLKDELGELSSSPRAFEQSFDEWELLQALIFGETNKIVPDQDGKGWLTPGRYVYLFMYNSTSPLFPPGMSEDSVDLCKGQKPFESLISAGYFGGKWERILELRSIIHYMGQQGRFG
jgi:hypothetical protein